MEKYLYACKRQQNFKKTKGQTLEKNSGTIINHEYGPT
jgi:hypothetical protein